MLQVYGIAVPSNRKVRIVSTGNFLSTTRTNQPSQSRQIKVVDLDIT